jgi:hypothetical protein
MTSLDPEGAAAPQSKEQYGAEISAMSPGRFNTILKIS